MTDTFPTIYGIGNPLIDVVISAMDDDLKVLKLNKGIMELVDLDRQEDIIKYFKDKKPRYLPGGSAPNTMLACAGLGTSSLIAGKIGKDEFGEIYVDQVEKYGAVSGLVQGDGPTGSSIILVTPDGERTMNTHLGMCREFSADDIDTEKLSQSTFFYFTGYMWDTESQKAAVQKAITIAHENNVQIAFDVADPFAVNRYRDEFLKLIKQHVDIVFTNQFELSILFDTEDIDGSIKQLMNIVDRGGIKLGKKGSCVFENRKKHFITPKPISATDSTGAGDMYAAGFLASLSKGNGCVQAGELGVFLAEEIIQNPGAQFDITIMKRLKETII
ncbi:MAG: adenosine kinase [Candidatus Neomarinimicrobiota bacterium]|nr:adenosine kinase [Candidatus Neomarinimicrobiota bacterium]